LRRLKQTPEKKTRKENDPFKNPRQKKTRKKEGQKSLVAWHQTRKIQKQVFGGKKKKFPCRSTSREGGRGGSPLKKGRDGEKPSLLISRRAQKVRRETEGGRGSGRSQYLPSRGGEVNRPAQTDPYTSKTSMKAAVQHYFKRKGGGGGKSSNWSQFGGPLLRGRGKRRLPRLNMHCKLDFKRGRIPPP